MDGRSLRGAAKATGRKTRRRTDRKTGNDGRQRYPAALGGRGVRAAHHGVPASSKHLVRALEPVHHFPGRNPAFVTLGAPPGGDVAARAPLRPRAWVNELSTVKAV